MSSAAVHSAPSVTLHCTTQVCSVPYGELLCTKFSLEPTDDTAVASKICIASAEYRQGYFVIITSMSNPEDNPAFAKIVAFVSGNNSDCWFLD